MERIPIKKHFSWASFFLLLSLLVTLAGLYLYNIFGWASFPDFGFSFRTATGIHAVGVLREYGMVAGLEIGDRILKVNGLEYSTYSQLNHARKWEIGESNSYLIQRGDRQFETTIPNRPLGFKRAFTTSGLPLVFGFCYMLIGALVFLMKPNHRTSWVFFNLAAAVGLFLVFLFKTSVLNPPWLENVIILAYCFMPASLFHMGLSFPQERSVVKRYPVVQLLPYAGSAILFLVIRSATHTMTDAPKGLIMAAVGYMAAGVLFFLGSCVDLRVRSSSEIARRRSQMILLGAVISASLPLLDFVTNTLFGVYLVPGFNYYLPFFIVFPLFIAYSIVKHDLFDIDAVIKRTYGYVLTTGTLAGIYGLLIFISNQAFGGYAFAQSRYFPLLFILAVVFFFNPIRNRVQRIIDRVFYRLEYDYQETVESISESLRTILGLEQIGQSMMHNSVGIMFVDTGGVLIHHKSRKHYEFLIRCGEREKHRRPEPVGRGKAENPNKVDSKLPPTDETCETFTDTSENRKAAEFFLAEDNPLIRKIAEQKEEATVYDIQEDPFFESDREECLQILDRLDATVVVPLIYEERLTGLLTLGRKKSGKFYRKEDINLLHVLANQGAIAIENARMVEEVIEKERMEEELNIARDLQMSMLPAACPEIRGFEMAASSMPAREVGGDFYDFIDMGEDRAGLVVADVTGKSVSGALVMSASRSVFRMLSEEKLTVGDIMVRANRRIKKDIKSGMFVALLYAVLDARDGGVSLCSAGQTQPIHFCAETGEAMLVETEGDHFPLGILDEADYQETLLRLTPGDMVVFYTDGIVEAMNEKQEMFGFDRLLETVRGATSMTAGELLKTILDRVNTFAGSATQHDDLTVIVVNVVGSGRACNTL